MSVLLLAMLLTATATEERKAAPALDCKAGYDALVAAAVEAPGTKPLPVDPQESLRAFDVPSNRTLVVHTLEDHSAHPMVIRREVVTVDGRVSIATTACGYGDKAASDRLIDAYKRLDERIQEEVAKPK